MKNLILLLLTTFTLCCCDNNNDKPKTELEKLPPATQTGANTVGCLLDGKAFLPGNQPNSTNCFFQFVDGEYYFVMAFDNRDVNSNLIGLGVGTQKLQIQQGGTYSLIELSENNAYGGYTYGTFENFTDNINTGELKITKLDEVNGIVSGSFWYNVLDTQNVVHHITEGRFDMQYTN